MYINVYTSGRTIFKDLLISTNDNILQYLIYILFFVMAHRHNIHLIQYMVTADQLYSMSELRDAA